MWAPAPEWWGHHVCEGTNAALMHGHRPGVREPRPSESPVADGDTEFQQRTSYDTLLLIQEGKGAEASLAQLPEHLVSPRMQMTLPKLQEHSVLPSLLSISGRSTAALPDTVATCHV